MFSLLEIKLGTLFLGIQILSEKMRRERKGERKRPDEQRETSAW